ncbi:C39 family peptidase [Paenibacillus sp. BR2-3]|uniref:C39 family peptidase n=1 Tax=Paenibacillus sp. BR2-3 TaxID=3048494 RepID=UPI0039778400
MKKKEFIVLTWVGFLWTIILVLILSFFNVDEPYEVAKKDIGHEFTVYSKNNLETSFASIDGAIAYAKSLKQASVRSKLDGQLYWNNYDDFTVYQTEKMIADFAQFQEAVRYAKKFRDTKIYFNQGTSPVWENINIPPITNIIDAPLISQMPELPRGCEVTSLTMLLQYAGVKVDKMKLAAQIKRDPTPYEKRDGVTYFGNPYDGFVGDMYSFSNPGYGVYHGPIRELVELYMPDQIIDMTGSEFQDILYSLDYGIPVWVIVNTNFSRLSDSLFETWQTPTGQVSITYKEHSVLITGYDETFIYFNDPLAYIKNRKIPIRSFQEGWEQMGKQAITYVEDQTT